MITGMARCSTLLTDNWQGNPSPKYNVDNHWSFDLLFHVQLERLNQEFTYMCMSLVTSALLYCPVDSDRTNMHQQYFIITTAIVSILLVCEQFCYQHHAHTKQILFGPAESKLCKVYLVESPRVCLPEFLDLWLSKIVSGAI